MGKHKTFELWKKYKEVATRNQVSYKTFRKRIYNKWTEEDAANTYYHERRERLKKWT